VKRYVLRGALYLGGASFLALGVQLAIISNLGAGSFDAMYANLHHLLQSRLFPGLSLGTTMALTMVVLYIIAMILKPRFYYLFGFGLSVFTGAMIDLFGLIIPEVQILPFRVLYYLLALVCIAFGVALIIKSKFPLTPMDNLMMIVVEKTKKPVALIKTLLDLLYAAIAILFGYLGGIGFGAVNLGSIIMAFLMGPLINIFLKVLKTEK